MEHTAKPSTTPTHASSPSYSLVIPYYHIKQLTSLTDRIPSSTAIPFSIVTFTIIPYSHPSSISLFFLKCHEHSFIRQEYS